MPVDPGAASGTLGGVVGIGLAAAVVFVGRMLDLVHLGKRHSAIPADIVRQAQDDAARKYMPVIEEMGAHLDAQGDEMKQLMQQLNGAQVHLATLSAENQGLKSQVAELRRQIERQSNGRH